MGFVRRGVREINPDSQPTTTSWSKTISEIKDIVLLSECILTISEICLVTYHSMLIDFDFTLLGNKAPFGGLTLKKGFPHFFNHLGVNIGVNMV